MSLRRLVCSVTVLLPLLSLACSDDADPVDGGAAGSSPGVAGSAPGAGGSAAGSASTAGSSGSGAGGSVGAGGGGTGSSAPSEGGTAGVPNAGGTAGVPGAGGTAGVPGAGGSGGVPTDGPGLYGFHCASCHGEVGKGGVLAPEIQHPIRDYATWVVRNGRPANPSYPKPMEKASTELISDQQLTLILDYLDTPPQPTTGQGLYQDYCMNCHGADAKSGPAKRDLKKEANSIPMDVRAGHHPGEFSKRDGYMPAFPAARLSDAEIQLIKTYVESL